MVQRYIRKTQLAAQAGQMSVVDLAQVSDVTTLNDVGTDKKSKQSPEMFKEYNSNWRSGELRPLF